MAVVVEQRLDVLLASRQARQIKVDDLIQCRRAVSKQLHDARAQEIAQDDEPRRVEQTPAASRPLKSLQHTRIVSQFALASIPKIRVTGFMFRDQVVLITGASSGIGRALADEFARQGARLGTTDDAIDVLVTITGRDTPLEEYRAAFETNFFGPFALLQKV